MLTRQRRGLLAVLLTLLALAVAWGEQAESFSFGVFGDCQPAGKGPYSPVLEAIASELSELGVDFVIGTGDYIDGSSNQAVVRRQWQGFFQGLAPLQSRKAIPVALAPGNHDIMGLPANEAIFTEYFQDLYFSFNAGRCHFIVLNTNGSQHYGMIDDRQLQWLKRDLETYRDALFIFVALHQPLFPVDGHIGSALDVYPKRRDALHQLFVRSGVDCVFQGHEHLYNHQQRDGVHYFINGGAGGPLYASRERGGFHHYLLVRVEGERYEVTVRRINLGT